MPFLTLQDPRAKVKGSRDPLGLVPLWYVPARRLIGNLTTVAKSLRGSTLLSMAGAAANASSAKRASPRPTR